MIAPIVALRWVLDRLTRTGATAGLQTYRSVAPTDAALPCVVVSTLESAPMAVGWSETLGERVEVTVRLMQDGASATLSGTAASIVSALGDVAERAGGYDHACAHLGSILLDERSDDGARYLHYVTRFEVIVRAV